MLEQMKRWYERNFHDEEAVVLIIILAVATTVVMTIGEILTPVIAALVLAFVLQGVVVTLVKYRVPHIVAVTLGFLLLVVVMAAFLGVLMPIVWTQVSNLVKEMPRLIELFQANIGLLPERYPTLITYEQVNDWSALLNKEVGDFGQSVLSFSLSKIPNMLTFLIYLVLVPIMVFFFLKDKENLLSWCGSLLPEERPLLTRIWVEMNDQMANYVRGKVVEMIIVGAVAYISFVFLELNYAALLALLVGLSVVVPYLGALLVTIPVLLVGFLQWGWGSDFMWLTVVYGVIQALDGNVLVPLLFSEAVNLHPVAIILAVLIFGGLWGVWGVFFAIPLATLIKAVLSAWPRMGSVSPSVEVDA